MDGASIDTSQPTSPPEWHAESEYLTNNPEDAKAFTKYQTKDDQLRAHRDAMRLLGQPYRLPKDHSKLNDEQKTEIRGFVRGMNGVPDSPDGYAFEVGDDVPIDEEAMTAFRKLAHERGLDPQTAQDALGIQIALVKRLNGHREKVIQGMTDANYKVFLNDDCQGDKELAGARLEQVRRFLQSKCVDKDGKPDSALWEKFAARIMYNDRIIELPLLRALVDAAQMAFGTGGAPGAFTQQVMSGGGLYSEMRPKKR